MISTEMKLCGSQGKWNRIEEKILYRESKQGVWQLKIFYTLDKNVDSLRRAIICDSKNAADRMAETDTCF